MAKESEEQKMESLCGGFRHKKWRARGEGEEDTLENKGIFTLLYTLIPLLIDLENRASVLIPLHVQGQKVLISTFPRSHCNSREHGYTLVPKFSIFPILIMCIFVISLLLSFQDLLLFIFSLFFIIIGLHWFVILGMGIVIGFVKLLLDIPWDNYIYNNATIILYYWLYCVWLKSELNTFYKNKI